MHRAWRAALKRFVRVFGTGAQCEPWRIGDEAIELADSSPCRYVLRRIIGPYAVRSCKTSSVMRVSRA